MAADAQRLCVLLNSASCCRRHRRCTPHAARLMPKGGQARLQCLLQQLHRNCTRHVVFLIRRSAAG